MTKHVLFIHGAGGEAYDEDGKLVDSLREKLGNDYAVTYPAMPHADNPEYEAWKEVIAKEYGALKGSVIFAGHSLGASFLLKYLSETKLNTPIAGIFLMAAPFWGAKDWEYDPYALADGFAAKLPKDTPMFLYHSRGDEWVPFEHLALYAERLPQAIVRQFDGRGHQFDNDLSEVAADIKGL